MNKLKSIAAGTFLAGTLGLAAIGVSAGIANAEPPGVGWAQHPGYGPGPGWHGNGYDRGPGWYPPPPPPPPPAYYGGYDQGYGYGGPGPGLISGCAHGPLGLLQVCV